jgi:hypothetical protein
VCRFCARFRAGGIEAFRLRYGMELRKIEPGMHTSCTALLSLAAQLFTRSKNAERSIAVAMLCDRAIVNRAILRWPCPYLCIGSRDVEIVYGLRVIPLSVALLRFAVQPLRILKNLAACATLCSLESRPRNT